MSVEKKAQAQVLEKEKSMENLTEFNEAMKKTEIKVRLAKSIESLQEQIEELNRLMAEKSYKHDTLTKDLANLEFQINKQSKCLADVTSKVKSEYKDQVKNIDSMQKRLNNSVTEYQKLIDEEKRKHLDLDRRNKALQEREDSIARASNKREIGYKEIEKELTAQYNSVIAEKSKVQESIKDMKLQRHHLELESRALDKKRAEVVSYESKVKQFEDNLKKKEQEVLGKLNDKQASLEKACQEAILERNNYEERYKSLKSMDNQLKDREIAVLEAEKSINDRIKQYKLDELKK